MKYVYQIINIFVSIFSIWKTVIFCLCYIHDFTDVKNIYIISDLQIHKGIILLDHNRINLDIQFLLDFNI